MTGFKDYFSKHAGEYSKYRPNYPEELFSYLSSLTEEHSLAWDCACGNGQASIELARYYDNIIATDASSSQIANAIPHPNINYYTALAEESGIENNCADLITAATAIHFFANDKFYSEVKRILKKNGVIAVWNYAHSDISPEVNNVLQKFAYNNLEKYWPEETVASWNFEENIQFPFKRIQTPEFYMTAEWKLEELINYIFTWSAVQNFIKAENTNPVESIENELIKAWGNDNSVKKIKWKLNMKIGTA